MKVKTIFSRDNKYYLVTTDDGIPITDVCKYLKSRSLAGLSDSTVSSDAYDLANFFEYLDISGVNYLNINSLEDFISYIGSKNPKSYNRIKNITTTIINFYEFISECKENNENIEKIKEFDMSAYDSKNSNQIKTKADLIDDIEGICKLTTNLRDELLLRLFFETGARGSEIINLTIDDLNYSGDSISLCLKNLSNSNCYYQEQCYLCSYNYNGYYLNIPNGKLASHDNPSRIVPISKKLASLIIEYDKTVLSNINSEKKSIFIHLKGTNIGKQLSYSYISVCLKSLSKKSNLNINTHSFRNPFITNLLMKYDLETVSYIAGLTSSLSTYNYINKLRGDASVSSTPEYTNFSHNNINKNITEYKIDKDLKNFE